MESVPPPYDYEKEGLDFSKTLHFGQLVAWRDKTRESKTAGHCLGFISRFPKGFEQTGMLCVVEIISLHPVLGESMGAKGVPHIVHFSDLFLCPDSYRQQVTNEMINLLAAGVSSS